jgi:hypothetical protein
LAPVSAWEERGDCSNSCSGIVSFDETLFYGVGPYSYVAQPAFVFTEQIGTQVRVHGVCAMDPTMVTVTDANGCQGSFALQVFNIPLTSPSAAEHSPACGGDANGSIRILDGWGDQMWYHIYDTNGGTVLDTLVQGSNDPVVLTGVPPGNYQVEYYDPNTPSHYLFCAAPAYVTVTNIPAPCGSVSGKIFNDVDRDCTQDVADDIALAYRVLTIQPGPSYTVTDAAGRYTANVPFGSYTIEQPQVLETQICPATSPVPFTVDLNTFDAVVDMADSSNAPHDLSIYISATQLRPGFAFQLWGTVWNNSAYVSGNLTLDLTYDAVLGSVIVSPGPTSVSAGSVHWDLAPIAPYGSRTFYANGTVPADIGLLGTPIAFQAVVGNAAAEVDLTNNAYTVNTTIVGSYDPNDKQAVTDNGNTLAYLLEDDHEVTYTIRFQNTGTASAVNVVVRDTIEADLDITSLKILGSSHAFVPSIPSGRVLEFAFNNIHLPDSGADERLSHGFISFCLKPRADIIVGDVLTNTAGIYFDFNPPIITNTSVLPVEMSTGVTENSTTEVLLRPNPVTDELTVVLPGASAIAGRIEVLAADGRVVPVSVEARGSSAVLDVRALSAGAYLVRCTDGVVVRTARFMKR